MIYIILLAVAFIILAIGAFTDIKTREVPDWVNYAGIFAGIGIRLLYSAITFDWTFIIYGLAGLGLFAGIAYAMFYTGQWGGGDAKMLFGLGALVGFDFSFRQFPLIFVLLINILFAGAVYGMLSSVYLAVKNRKKFSASFKEKLNKFRKQKLILTIISIIILAFAIFFIKGALGIMLLAITILANATFYLFIFIKSVEHSSMFRYVEPEKLTEGEWIAKEYKVGGKYICGPKDLGIEKKQIKKLIQLKNQGKISKIKIKLGIPFVPSFLIAFVITLIFGAWWFYLI